MTDDSVAQLVEHYTFNVGVLGSSPSGITRENYKGRFKRLFLFEGESEAQLQLSNKKIKKALASALLFLDPEALLGP